MDVPPEPIVLAEQGGLIVAERGPEIIVIDRGNGALQILTFVLMIVTLVFGLFGLIAVISAAGSGVSAVPAAAGVAILAVGVLAGVATALSANRIRARRRRRLTSFIPIAVFDRAQWVHRSGTGEVVAPLHQVRFERRMQLTSSSAKLVAVTPYGEYVLKRGNPFGGSVGTLDRVLTGVLHGPRR